MFRVVLMENQRAFFEEYFELPFGRAARSEEELRQAVRQITNASIDHVMAQELERVQPGRVSQSMGEVFKFPA